MTASPLALLPTAFLLPTNALAQTQNRPNIVLFLVDDMGWQETSVPFYKEKTLLNSRYRTPNMEQLASRGVKFTQAYASAISSPSRCSLLSGMNAARHKVTNWTFDYNVETDMNDPEMMPPTWNCNGIQPDTVTSAHNRHRTTLITPLPQLLKDVGYYTIHCGKAHFGARTTAGEDPRSFGFMVNIAGGANGGPASYLARKEFGSNRFHVYGLEQYYNTDTFLTEALTIEAIKALNKPITEGKPFFLYMSHYAIHVPYEADERFTPNYRQANGQGMFDPMLQQPLNENEINHAALIEGMDKSLGDLLRFIDSKPEVARNTIVIFMSDNGGQAIDVRQGRHNYDQNYPARGGKGSALEGGIHEPMLVYWPGVTCGGTENHNRVMIEDFFPSLLDMAQISQYRTSQVVDGRSFVPLLRNPKLHRKRQIVWHYPHFWTTNISEHDGYGPSSALMHGPYHLIYYWRTNTCELYNVTNDIGESNNLAHKMHKLTSKLKKMLFKKLDEYGAQKPTWKTPKH